jgi:hypothetical protein
MASYDIIVVGAGIAGLYSALELKKKYPSYSIAVAERYKGLGGRTYSYSHPGFPGIAWEMGAGRVHKDHKLVMNLLKVYDLTWIPISSKIAYLEKAGSPIIPNPFESTLVPLYLEPLSKLPEKSLGSYTIKQLMIKVYGSDVTKMVLDFFPYRAEVNTLRADLGLKAFLGKGEMGSHEGYGVVKEGFGELISRLKADLESRGCTILPRHRLMDLNVAGTAGTDLLFQFGYGDEKILLRATKAVILALHKDAVEELPAFSSWKVLNHLETKPLLRAYAIFPASRGKSWFSGLSRIVTPQRPRYILPIDPSKGVLMISYTDAEDTNQYMEIQKRVGDEGLEKVILEDVRALFPDRKIPAPRFFRSHPWETGATYWIPGKYNPELESRESVHPLPSKLPNVWLCGESWSLRQAWVEGALESAEAMLESFNKK